MNLPAFVVAAFLLSLSGCARQEIMARPGESKLTAAPVRTAAAAESPPPALAIAPEIRSACHLHEKEGAGAAPKLDFDASLLASAEIGTLEQVATCFTTGPMKGRSLTLRGRADPRAPRPYTPSLGDRRASAVQSALVSFGMPVGSVPSTSRGGTDAAGKDESGWETDREVDVSVEPIR